MRAKFPEQQLRVALQSEHNSEISYSTKFSWIFNFANVANFQLFAKLFQQKFSSFYTLTARASMHGKHLGAKLQNPQTAFSKEIPYK